MANEISLRFKLLCENGDYKFERSLTKNYTQSTAGHSANTQSVGTSHEVLDLPADIATKGQYFVINQDATNYVEIGIVTGGVFYPLDQIKPGELKYGRIASGVAPYVKANTATCKIESGILSA